MIGGALLSALAAEWLTSTWDQNTALYACGPAAAVVEEIAGAWLKELLGLPSDASFAFTSVANSPISPAWLDNGWDVNAYGLSGAPTVRKIASDQRHASVDRALRFWVLGTEVLPLFGQMRTDSLPRRLFKMRLPLLRSAIVVLNAGDLDMERLTGSMS